MNSTLMFSSKKQDWETPSKFFDEINSKYHFSFDLAANIQNAKCQRFYTPLDDSLDMDLSSYEKKIIADYLKNMLVDCIWQDENITNQIIALAIKDLENE